MLVRRCLLAGSAASTLLGRHSLAQDDSAYWDTVLRDAYAFKPSDVATLGSILLPPSDPRWTEAKNVLRATPTRGRPYDVAVALDSAIPDLYRSEWPTSSANPLIVLLYAATKTKPSGDVTAWCAAFISWCIERVGFTSMHSASSQDYRKFGTEVWKKGMSLPGGAQPGDLCVFTRKSDPSSGHVTFFRSTANNLQGASCLGGNQADSIKVSTFPINADLELLTIRRI